MVMVGITGRLEFVDRPGILTESSLTISQAGTINKNFIREPSDEKI